MPQPHPVLFWLFVLFCVFLVMFVLYIFGVGGKHIPEEIPTDVQEPTQEEFDSKE